ncbi:hypothetical protein ACFE04_005416 [Oxalis oulophora]
MVKEEEECSKSKQYIYEARDERMVCLKTGISTVRIARFLNPVAKSVSKAVKVPNNQQRHECPSNVRFIVQCPQAKWQDWIDKSAGKYAHLWNQTGICDSIMASMYHVPFNRDLILAFVQFWCPETNTFVFPWGEATITLEDVMILGGFPVLGKAVTKILGETGEIDRAMNRKRIELTKTKARKASHSAWIDHFMEITNNNNEGETDLEHVAFLSLWLSRYVFPSQIINKNVFPIAAELSKGAEVSLGPAVLAGLYSMLSSLKTRSSQVFLARPFQLVQLWVFERFPMLGPKFLNPLKPGEPRIARFHELKQTINLELIKSTIESVKDFIWRPYSANLTNWRHLAYYRETKHVFFDFLSFEDNELLSFVQCVTVSELEGLGVREKYLPHRVAMQFGMDQDLPGDFPTGCPTGSRKNLRFFIPSMHFEAGVSLEYFNWWKESVQSKHGDQKSLKDTSKDTNLKRGTDHPDIQLPLSLIKNNQNQELDLSVLSDQNNLKDASKDTNLKREIDQPDIQLPLSPIRTNQNQGLCDLVITSGDLKNLEEPSTPDHASINSVPIIVISSSKSKRKVIQILDDSDNEVSQQTRLQGCFKPKPDTTIKRKKLFFTI